MGKVLNKRNAVIGWLALGVGKRVAKKRVKEALPEADGGRAKKKPVLAAVAALGGVLFFWRKRRRSAGES